MSDTHNPKILVISDYYLPGYKSGGGLRTLVNMVDRLHGHFDFYVITRDHDYTVEKERYTNVAIDHWNDVGHARAFYLPRRSFKPAKLRELISAIEPELLFFNSYFSPLTIYTLLLRKLKLIPEINVVLAPCGELSENALEIKRAKKRLFLRFAKAAALYCDLDWKASTELEKLEIEKIMGTGEKITVVPDLSPREGFASFSFDRKPEKKPGEAKMIFLSRLARKKNFKWLLEHLKAGTGNLEIDVFGPIEEKAYWEECLKLIGKLPPNIKVREKGALEYEQVAETLARYHFFILPTLNENYGYALLEAMACGCPPIVSDQTPWRNLEAKGIGWDIPLEAPGKWVEVIEQCLEMDARAFARLSNNAALFAREWLADPKIEESTRRLLDECSGNKA